MLLLTSCQQAEGNLSHFLQPTPLVYHEGYSQEIRGKVWFKREDLQPVRSYKIRGAMNLMLQLSEEEKKRGIVAASAGNHAQGVAYACVVLGIKGVIFMPETTPKQKLEQVKRHGKDQIEIRLVGDTFDDSYHASRTFQEQTNRVFVHPFDDDRIIAGQATVGLEMLQQLDLVPDVVLVPVGGGGLLAGLVSSVKQQFPQTEIWAVEPTGAPSLQAALDAGQVVTLDSINRFVDGAAVKQIGQRNFDIVQHQLAGVLHVPEGKICETILNRYNSDGWVLEPAGALTTSALELYGDQFQGKNVVAIVSGGNNDISRMNDIQERALLYRQLKHYFLVEFPQRPGALKQFVTEVLSEQDDISMFQFTQKQAVETGPALIGIQTEEAEGKDRLMQAMENRGYKAIYVNDEPLLFGQLVG